MEYMKSSEYMDKLNEAKEYIFSITNGKLEGYCGLILGSGLGNIEDEIEDKIVIDYRDIPNMPTSIDKSRRGEFVIGNLRGKKVVLMIGRLCKYEGYSGYEISFSVRLFKLIGIENLVITTASGGINEGYAVGDIMLIKDHLNMSGFNPLVGSNIDEFGQKFVSLEDAYNTKARKKILTVCEEKNIDVKEGIFAYMLGPTYETHAEINMLRMLGADAVSMSTVPEVIVARHMGIKVIAISFITNVCNSEKPTTHKEVLANAKKVKDKLEKVLEIAIENM